MFRRRERTPVLVECEASTNQLTTNPLNLEQTDNRGCQSAVVANLLYMFGKTNKPDPIWVDSKTGRQPGCRSPNRIGATLLLLEHGFSLRSIGSFDSERAINEGYSYYREFYADKWDASYQQYFTPAKIAELQLISKNAKKLFQPFTGQMDTSRREPISEDIDSLLEEGWVIMTDVKFSSGIGAHTCLLYGATDKGEYSIYLPETTKPGKELQTLYVSPPENFLPFWHTSNGIAAVSLPG